MTHQHSVLRRFVVNIVTTDGREREVAVACLDDAAAVAYVLRTEHDIADILAVVHTPPD